MIEAKVTQAPAVDFKLEVDDLSKLKSAGVSQSVISAMLKRSTASAAPVAATAQAGPPPGVYGPNGMPVSFGAGNVKLVASGQNPLVLRAVGGTTSTTYAFVTTLFHVNFPGEKAAAYSRHCELAQRFPAVHCSENLSLRASARSSGLVKLVRS